MKTIILPTEGIAPRIEYHADLLAIHISETEVVLIDTGAFSDGPLAEVPAFLTARDLCILGIIQPSEVLGAQLQQNRRRAQWNLQESQKRAAELAASIEQQRAELEAMDAR